MSRPGDIDLNSDVGEGFGPWVGGPDAELMQSLTSVNVACGFHAGDPSIMRTTCELAVRGDCAIGAQVSYPDLVGFGRRFMDMKPSELTDAVLYQIGALDAFANTVGSRVRYVKPHGALYNAIVENEAQAMAVVRAVREYSDRLPLLGLPGSAVQRACAKADLAFVTEGFADRAYNSAGQLVPRSQAGALIVDPRVAAEQACSLAAASVRSICVHSDTPGAVEILTAVARALTEAGHNLQSFVT